MKDKVTPYDLLNERLVSMNKALELQAKEYERRLESLNGEAGRIRDILKESIPREIFDREINSIRTRLAQTEAALIKAEGRHQLTQYVPWIIAAAAIVFDYFKK